MYTNAQEYEDTEIAKASNKIDSYVGSVRDISPNNYKSDGTEVKTNEMFDGKPIYAKYVSVVMSSGDWTNVAHNIANIDTIWIDTGNSYAVPRNNNDDYKYELPRHNNGCGFRVNSTHIGTCNTGWGGDTAYLLLKYTKTTD